MPPYSPQLNFDRGIMEMAEIGMSSTTCSIRRVQEIRANVQAFIQRINQHPEQTIDWLCVRL
uniref:Putative transposase n=1 Tax=Anoxybacteroides tepidamans TaxID=265948 RepID=A2BD27_9BACL|nr:putative transposase [Anoxybacillus tepidamans]